MSGNVIQDLVVRTDEIHLPTNRAPAMGNVNTVAQNMSWVKVPVSADSGATANVAPKDIFTVEIIPKPQSMANEHFNGADGGTIKNHGKNGSQKGSQTQKIQ